MGVSKNRGTPKSSLLIGLFHYFHHPFWGVKSPYFWFNTHMQQKLPKTLSRNQHCNQEAIPQKKKVRLVFKPPILKKPFVTDCPLFQGETPNPPTENEAGKRSLCISLTNQWKVKANKCGCNNRFSRCFFAKGGYTPTWGKKNTTLSIVSSNKKQKFRQKKSTHTHTHW